MAFELIPPSMGFRYRLSCRHHDAAGKLGLKLTDDYLLPSFTALDGAPELVQVRAAWNRQALHFQLRVNGKKQAPWCRATMLDSSDGWHVWIDTRDTHNIHRAGRFCNRFVFLPGGAGPKLDQPTADQLLINRARENAAPIRPRSLQVGCLRHAAGYELEAIIPTTALTGFDADEYPRLGFFWAVEDRELGTMPLALDTQFPWSEDPSLWTTLELESA